MSTPSAVVLNGATAGAFLKVAETPIHVGKVEPTNSSRLPPKASGMGGPLASEF
jgi:hypothetical protein